jgi:serine/threonine-protein kinase
VIARASVMQFRQRDRNLRDVAAALGASTVLDGSVRHAADRVRIVVELIDPATDRRLWGDTYDRQLTDIFAIQSEVAISIAAALRSELSLDERTSIRREPTRSMEAYQHYLRGRHLYEQFRREPLLRAIEYFRRAIAADPSYALAYASIAICYVQLAESGLIDARTARRETTIAAAAAIGLDPNLGEAHTALGYMKFVLEFDYPGAEAEFRRAIELLPGDANAADLYGRLCAALGRFDEALVFQRRAHELDPLNHRTDVATTLIRAGRYREAEADVLRAVEFDPDNPRARATLGWAYIKQGRMEEGLAELEQAAKLGGDSPQWLAQLGEALGMAGRHEAARDILRRLEEQSRTSYVSPYHLAYVHTGLGEHERALDRLEQALAERTGAIHGVKVSFLFEPLREHPRFRALVERMGAAPVRD